MAVLALGSQGLEPHDDPSEIRFCVGMAAGAGDVDVGLVQLETGLAIVVKDKGLERDRGTVAVFAGRHPVDLELPGMLVPVAGRAAPGGSLEAPGAERGVRLVAKNAGDGRMAALERVDGLMLPDPELHRLEPAALMAVGALRVLLGKLPAVLILVAGLAVLLGAPVALRPGVLEFLPKREARPVALGALGFVMRRTEMKPGQGMDLGSDPAVRVDPGRGVGAVAGFAGPLPVHAMRVPVAILASLADPLVEGEPLARAGPGFGDGMALFAVGEGVAFDEGEKLIVVEKCRRFPAFLAVALRAFGGETPGMDVIMTRNAFLCQAEEGIFSLEVRKIRKGK